MKNLRHIGIVVNDLEKAMLFYENVFELKLLNRMVEEGEYIEKLVNIKNASIEWAKLSSKDGTVIELLEYSGINKEDVEFPFANKLGCSHIAITVEDINDIYNKLIEYGCRCNSEPLFSPDGKVKVMYAYDLDGTILEIVEEL